MTPSSTILEYMADKGRQHGVVALHVEDEISAMNMAVGAGYTGVRAMVATSGGGFALMVEGLALAVKTAVVITRESSGGCHFPCEHSRGKRHPGNDRDFLLDGPGKKVIDRSLDKAAHRELVQKVLEESSSLKKD